LLLTFSNPFHPGKWVTVYFGKSPQALSRARYIFFYGWDSYILFKNGRPKERGNFSPRGSSDSYDFLSKDHFPKIDFKRLKEHVFYLASPELAGRFPGTPGYHKAQAYLIKQLERMGVTPVLQPFSITVKDVEEASLTVFLSNQEKKLKAIPLRFSKEGRWKGPFIIIDQDKTPEIDTLSDKGVIVPLNSTKNIQPDQLFRKVKGLQRKGAKAILFIIREEDLDYWAPYLTYPSFFPQKLGERLNKKENEGNYILPVMEASKVAARAKEPDFLMTIPVLFVSDSQAEEGWIKGILEKKEIEAQINLRFKEIQLKDSNIGAILEGNDLEMKKEFLVLGAHYDHLGRDEKGGFTYSGADDNASGVSALLEIWRSLAKRKADLKRSVILLFFGGEEWGLWGSRHFVDQPFVPLSQIKAMLSLDTIGGATDEKEVFLIGSSIHPSVAQISRRFMEPLGIKEGRNIDPYSFEFGSDHYPFHQRGIPALDFFSSDYKKVHTSRDQLESIDFEKLSDVTKLIYLTAYEFLTEP
ncbi:MAG TPA: M20/M25/M40 family metallo-hydrolase, partial [Thermodesulfobacteriota bacterium]|nr:M20/M25/M40 family metallo-hydrolase [Thermodesulfobacteriota bacterium]